MRKMLWDSLRETTFLKGDLGDVEMIDVAYGHRALLRSL